MKTDLRNLTLDEMKAWVLSKDQPKFRGKQLFEWVSKGTRDFREMRNLPESFRNVLMDTSSLDSLTLLRSQQSKTDGTQKFLFAVEGGDAVETVFMRYRYGNSLCISSQAGCRMGCAFCASGMKGLSRNLTAGELFSQVIDAEKETGMTVSHIVLMGTGEPFDNYEEVSKFLRIIRDPAGRGMSSRNITVSTCGLIPYIQRFSEDFPEVNLAISLHAPNQEIRSRIMPVSKKYSFGKLLGACRRYTEATHRRVTFEYALIKDVNDRDRDAAELANELRGMLCHVNLIPLNSVKETGFSTSGRTGARRFSQILEKHNIPVTIRRQLGADIDGACGQLRLAHSE